MTFGDFLFQIFCVGPAVLVAIVIAGVTIPMFLLHLYNIKSARIRIAREQKVRKTEQIRLYWATHCQYCRARHAEDYHGLCFGCGAKV